MSPFPHRYQGFTLVEVLLAIVILLVGVVAAIRIFPRGFDIISQTGQSATGMSLAKDMIAEFTAHPESLPDGIYPIDEAGNVLDTFDPSDVTAVNYVLPSSNIPDFDSYNPANAPTGNRPLYNWYYRHLFPTADPQARWPLWQPVGVRVLRRAVGERAKIPSEFTSDRIGDVTAVAAEVGGQTVVQITPVDAAMTLEAGIRVRVSFKPGTDGTRPADIVLPVAANTTAPTAAVTLQTNGASLIDAETLYVASSFAPKYIVRFGPIENSDEVVIYDLRYRRVSVEELKTKLHQVENLPDKLYYAIDDSTGAAYFLPDTQERLIRVSFYKVTDKTDGKLQRVIPKDPLTIPASTSNELVRFPLLDASDTSQVFVPGSEQINRAYKQANKPTYKLLSGEFRIVLNNPTISPLSSGFIFFSQADAGRTVKIDYTIADWSILHKDTIVDERGYLQVGMPLKLQTTPKGFRETSPWGIYGPLKLARSQDTDRPQKDLARPDGREFSATDNRTAVVLVDLRSGISMDVYLDGTDSRYPSGIIDSNRSIIVDFRRTGAVRLGFLHAPDDAKYQYRWQGAWQPNLTYYPYNVVSYEGKYYVNIASYPDSLQPTPPGNSPKSAKTVWGELMEELQCEKYPETQPLDTMRGYIDWSHFKGHNYRVQFRTTADWTVQFLRAPAAFSYRSALLDFSADASRPTNVFDPFVGWSDFCLGTTPGATPVDDAAWVAVPGVYAGHSVAVDYSYQRRPLTPFLGKVSEAATASTVVKVDDAAYLTPSLPVKLVDPTTGDVQAATIASIKLIDDEPDEITLTGPVTVKVNTVVMPAQISFLQRVTGSVNDAKLVPLQSTAQLSDGMQVKFVDPATGRWQPATIDTVDTASQITLVSPITLSANWLLIPANTILVRPHEPIQRVSGEVHVVPPRLDGKTISLFKLRHVPAPGTHVSVRGVSVTVRVFWSQPRSGTAAVYQWGDRPEKTTPVKERWQMKQMTTVLPSSVE